MGVGIDVGDIDTVPPWSCELDRWESGSVSALQSGDVLFARSAKVEPR